MSFKELLPDPKEKRVLKVDPETVMLELGKVIEDRYDGRIVSDIRSNTKLLDGINPVLNYTFYLVFTRHDNYAYPLFTAVCQSANGSYPVNVLSHYAPPIDHGTISNEDDFHVAIESILKEEKTRNVILAMY